MSMLETSRSIEGLLVARDPRGMARVRSQLEPGYCLRAAEHLLSAEGNVLVCTGFPVAGTFETDGPPGALTLCNFLQHQGKQPWLLGGAAVMEAFGHLHKHQTLHRFDPDEARQDATELLVELDPSLIVVIERPGAAVDGRFYNIAGQDITDECRPVEPLMELADCPILAIGDGGNEAGMGKAGAVLEELNIHPAVIDCDELIVADVSNWGAYALVAMAQALLGEPVLADLDANQLLTHCIDRGGVDGVSHRAIPTEDGFDAEVGLNVIRQIQQVLQRGQ